jgi:hypothetical protein
MRTVAAVGGDDEEACGGGKEGTVWASLLVVVVVRKERIDGLMTPKSNVGKCRRSIRIPFLVIPH